MTNAAATIQPSAIDILRNALPDLGFTLSTDTDDIFRSLYNDTRKVVSRPPTRGEMRAVVTTWIAWSATRETGSMAKTFQLIRGALNTYQASKAA